MTSNQVLAHLTPGLQMAGFQVEIGKKRSDAVPVPVLFGEKGRVEKFFSADAWNRKDKTVLEVEAGTAVANNAYLKDLFQACMMHEVDYLAIAVRKRYLKSPDYARVVNFFETIYVSRRLKLPLNGVLVIGY